MTHSFFRREALEARSTAFLGATVLRPPLSFAAWSLIAATLAAAAIAFLFFGEYTKRTRVVGITAPDAGLIKLLAPAPGLVVERRVSEGQSVRAGDVLFVLSAERLTDSAGGVLASQTQVLEQLRRRRASLAEEQSRQRLLVGEQSAALRRRLADLTEQAAQLEREIATQTERVTSVRAQLARFEELARKQFMSEIAVQQKREEALDQQSRLQQLERNRTAVRSDAAAAAAELKQLPLKAEQNLAEVERAIAALEQDLASTEANRQIVIAAPQDGTVTAILTDKGQMAASQPLATLLPADGKLEAHLYAPSRAVGFVEPGQKVRLRYAAYPYQKFGQYEGRVAQVSRTALAANEVPQQLAALAQQAGADGLYRITVALAAPTVLAYGKPQPLAAGMQLEADILQDTRTLIEWVFEPLVSLRGKM
ncbi:MAG: HlyD family secretion protein [Betaproteobacteria bacterium]|jgi:membrane fusion protein